MPIPDYQQFMLPLMQFASNGQEFRLSAAIDAVADQLGLSASDRAEPLPSGTQTKVVNRVSWACIYLAKAGLLDRISRGNYRISEAGRQLLSRKPAQIDNKVLSQYPAFNEFKSLRATKGKAERELDEDDNGTDTPEDLVEKGYAQLRRALASDLLEKVKHCSPRFFERLVVDLLVAMGYGGTRRDAGKAVGQVGDGGIDGIIKEDKLGLDAVYIQAKRWEGPVGRPVAQGFSGSLDGHRARKGVLITTSRFTDDAREYVERIEKKIVLIDGEELAQLMIDHGIGVADMATYALKRVDADYFEE
jgi:restriction system protein